MIVEVKVLRHNDNFNVYCQKDSNIAELKRFCIKFSKIPIKECSIICEGIKIDNENLLVKNTQIAQSKKIFVFVLTLLEKVENEIVEAFKLFRRGVPTLEFNEKNIKLLGKLMHKGMRIAGIPEHYRRYIENYNRAEYEHELTDEEEFY